MEKQKALQKWVKVQGLEKTAQLLKINPKTIEFWIKRKGYPRVEMVKKINKVSGLSYNQIIDSCS